VRRRKETDQYELLVQFSSMFQIQSAICERALPDMSRGYGLLAPLR
jgi:hypothetical protein